VTRWLVTGSAGQLGSDLLRALAGRDAVGCDRTELDVADGDAVAAAFARYRPTVVVNAAAFTAVDDAEGHPEPAFRVNAVGPGVLAEACAAAGALLVHVSTDYVFDGSAREPYAEDATVCPASVYGRSKAAGERAVLDRGSGYVVRTAWVYGARGRNFVKTMVALEARKREVRVVDDQRGSPTWSLDLANGLVELAERRPPAGIYHCTNAGDTTWYGLARAVFEELGADPDRVRPTTTAEFPRPAPRPAFSVLSPAGWIGAGLRPLPDWRVALRRAFEVDGVALGRRSAVGSALPDDEEEAG
jgi:dTDP-4-dehydrorhamnose reductase